MLKDGVGLSAESFVLHDAVTRFAPALGWSPTDVNATAFRRLVRAMPVVTFDEIDPMPAHLVPSFEDDLDAMVEQGWTLHGQRMPSFRRPIQWEGNGRSFLFHLHAWEPLSLLLKGISVTASPERARRYFQASRNLALDWIDRYQRPAFDMAPEEVIEAKSDSADQGFAWYDMGVGQRIYRLAYLLELECRSLDGDLATIELLYHALAYHHDVLRVESFFRAHSNHGLYQALGQLAAAKRFASVDAMSRDAVNSAKARLAQTLASHFTVEQVHKEHSPGYHAMLLGSLIGAQQTNLIDDPALIAQVDAMQQALAWFTKPNFHVAELGDTNPRRLAKGRSGDLVQHDRVALRFPSPQLQAIFSAGRIGSLPAPGVRAFPEAGYAVARLPPDGAGSRFEDMSYLAHKAAFHSRVHKHADHLTFLWFDHGRDVLIDPGRYAYAGKTQQGTELFKEGFWYADPNRIYVESTRAHNCVEIDGRNHRRTGAKPFGSGLVSAVEQCGLALFESAIVHHRSIRQKRRLILRPGHFLLVLDWLNDGAGAEHSYRQFFKFAPEWLVTSQSEGFHARHPGRAQPQDDEEAIAPLALRVGSFSPEAEIGAAFRGQVDPIMSGWASPGAYVMLPAASIHFAQSTHGRPARFATLFTFGETLAVDHAASRMNVTMSAARFVWSDDKGRNTLALQAAEGGFAARHVLT